MARRDDTPVTRALAVLVLAALGVLVVLHRVYGVITIEGGAR